MSRPQAMLAWLERGSDRLSPIVVKEVRQLARGREFHYAFNLALLVGLAVAFFGAADSLTGDGTSGRGTFAALTGALGLLGLLVVPLGAFSALRNERLEQTLELITLTALSPRRVVMGKLLAQTVKLATLFAGLAPFVAMSFLLGGVDFATILVSMLVVFMWSVCVSAACLFLSSLGRSRALSGLVFAAVGIVLLLAMLVFGAPRAFYFVMMRGGMGSVSGGMGAGGSTSWWTLAISTTFCLSLIANLVLLAENRLLLPSQNRSTALRLGFLVQLGLMAAWALSFIAEPGSAPRGAGEALLVYGALHLAVVATFTVTEDLVVPRRVRLASADRPPWRRVIAPLQPGGGNGALYVLLQMAGLLCVAWMLETDPLHWFVLACGYICFFTGAPVALFRAVRPYAAASLRLRIAVLVLLAGAMTIPDLLAYMLWQPNGLDLQFSVRHLLNPFRTLANVRHVEKSYTVLAELIGIMGVLAYVVLVRIGAGVTLDPDPDDAEEPETTAGERGSADVLS